MQKPSNRENPSRRPGPAIADEDPMDIPMENKNREEDGKASRKQAPGAIAGDGVPGADPKDDGSAPKSQGLLGPRA